MLNLALYRFQVLLFGFGWFGVFCGFLSWSAAGFLWGLVFANFPCLGVNFGFAGFGVWP